MMQVLTRGRMPYRTPDWKGGAPGYRNVQLPEVNAAAATFAVMEWRRRTGQYVSESPSFFQKFRLEKGRIYYA